MKVVVATHNQHKVSEIRGALDFEGWEFIALDEVGDYPEPAEDGDTFEKNARIKAIAAHAVTGLPALADDSGLVVDALGGRPGVYSSRYAGPAATDDDNNHLLLSEMKGVPADKRTARFVTVIVFLDAQGNETVARGSVEGKIGFARRGDEGFGYDPLFYPDVFDGKTTMAQIPLAEKNRISHRGNALRDLKAKLTD